MIIFRRSVTKHARKSSIPNDKTHSEQNYFITHNALLSIELNAHYLIYLYLLIEQDSIPKSTANNTHLFSSQQCENLFRDARSLSGIYSTRINFTIKQFLHRVNKLNALTELKQFELTNGSEKIVFPVYHKVKQLIVQTELNDSKNDAYFNSSNLEIIILEAYRRAQDMAISVGMDDDLIKNKLFNIQ